MEKENFPYFYSQIHIHIHGIPRSHNPDRNQFVSYGNDQMIFDSINNQGLVGCGISDRLESEEAVGSVINSHSL